VSGLGYILADRSPDSWHQSGGGQHRTTQLHEIIRDAGIEIRYVPSEAGCSNLRKYALGLKYLLRLGLRYESSLRCLRRHGAVAARLGRAFAANEKAKVLLWEDTHRARQATPLIARQAGVAVVALPHNLESLVSVEPGTRLLATSRRWREEVRHLGAASATFCCSREEQWLLALYGVAADFLPCFPSKSVTEHCLRIRERRRAVRPQRLLIMGSANYGPTFNGMARLLEMLKSLPHGGRLPVDIAGFGSETFQPLIEGTHYTLHGSVDAEALAHLLVQAKAVLLHQTAGGGALTRIPEMLMAGVPVLANPIAARSALHLEGVHVYESERDLFNLFGSELSPPAVPARPQNAESRLVERILGLIRRQ
jgi:hypothetical protein